MGRRKRTFETSEHPARTCEAARHILDPLMQSRTDPRPTTALHNHTRVDGTFLGWQAVARSAPNVGGKYKIGHRH